jgi:hypothetical protein
MAAVLQYHQPPIRRLPSAVFTRMRLAMDDYLVERSADGQPVFYWKYRLFHHVASHRYVGKVSVEWCVSVGVGGHTQGAFCAFASSRARPASVLKEPVSLSLTLAHCDSTVVSEH